VEQSVLLRLGRCVQTIVGQLTSVPFLRFIPQEVSVLCRICNCVLLENPKVTRCQKCQKVLRGLLALLAPCLLANLEKPSALLSLTPHDPAFAICDSMPLPACLFARAYGCSRFKGEAAFGKDTLLRQTFYGFRVHMRICWPGVITRILVAPANVHELSVLPEIAEFTSDLLIGDRNYHSPRPQRSWRVWAWSSWLPIPPKKRDPAPKKSALLRGFVTG
jgi:hypothetical protein